MFALENLTLLVQSYEGEKESLKNKNDASLKETLSK